jgi:hypothetical protein
MDTAANQEMFLVAMARLQRQVEQVEKPWNQRKIAEVRYQFTRSMAVGEKPITSSGFV